MLAGAGFLCVLMLLSSPGLWRHFKKNTQGNRHEREAARCFWLIPAKEMTLKHRAVATVFTGGRTCRLNQSYPNPWASPSSDTGDWRPCPFAPRVSHPGKSSWAYSNTQSLRDKPCHGASLGSEFSLRWRPSLLVQNLWFMNPPTPVRQK